MLLNKSSWFIDKSGEEDFKAIFIHLTDPPISKD